MVVERLSSGFPVPDSVSRRHPCHDTPRERDDPPRAGVGHALTARVVVVGQGRRGLGQGTDRAGQPPSPQFPPHPGHAGQGGTPPIQTIHQIPPSLAKQTYKRGGSPPPSGVSGSEMGG